MLVTKELLVAIDFYSMGKNTVEVISYVNSLVTTFFKISSFVFNNNNNKKTHPGLEKHDGK